MELILFLFGGTILIVGITWLVRTSERLKTLERRVQILREHQKAIQEYRTADDFPEKESPSALDVSAADVQRNQFTAAKEHAADPEKSKSPQTVSPPPSEEPEAKAPEDPAPEKPVEPPPIPESLAEPKPKPEKPAAVPDEEKPLIEWRPILEKIKLWPPSGENAEAAIFGWWLTRAGIVTLIIAAVFAGIRFSQEFPPWLWVLALTGAAAGLTALGEWLERRLQAFGRVISAGGLALGYFTAFAAFALPAMKLIHDPVIGVFVQILALAAVIAWSFWKRDQSIAAMAILLGYVSCGFSHHHDLDNFVIAGLLILAAGGGTVLVLRKWLWPHAIATIGSWGGFLILAVGEWARSDSASGFWFQPGEAPPFPLMLGSLLLLTAILEAANCLAEDRYSYAPESRPRERKWLSVLNTSAAIAVGWIAVLKVAPEELDTFFLSFAILMGGITAVRYWRGHPTGLTEAFFLKTVALLAFFFVERFDGPTRWLSLAVEAGMVLWVFRRTKHRWVEIGFGTVFLGALAFVWKDVLGSHSTDPWKLIGIPSFAGAATLVLLSAELALHSLWSSESVDSKDDESPGAINGDQVFRLIAAVFVGFAAAAFTFTLKAENPSISQPVFLSLVALALAAPVFLIKRFPPVIAGLAALIPAYFGFFRIDPFNHDTSIGVPAAIWFSLLAFALAELAYRTWLKRWHCGNAVRAILYALSTIALVDLILRIRVRFQFETFGSVFMILLFAAAGAFTLILLSRRFGDGHLSSKNSSTHAVSQWLVSILIGILTLFLAGHILPNHDYLSAWLAIAGAILFAAAFRTRNNVPAAAGALPLLGGILSYAIDFHREPNLGEHLFCAAVLIAVCLATSVVLWRVVDREKFPVTRTYELLLQALALFVIHWIFRAHLAVSEVFFADALLAAATAAAGRLAPFRTTPVLSSLPLALALLHAGVSSMGDGWGDQIYWWLTAAVVLGWIWFLYAPSIEKTKILLERPLYLLNGAAATGVLTLAGYQALDNPWHMVSLTGFAVLLAGLWRWEKIWGLHAWSALPLGFGAFAALLRINGVTDFEPADGLVAVSLVAAGIVGHGIILACRNPTLRPLIWVHGFIGLGLAFLAYAPGKLGVDELTTVCWGIAAIVLFVVGLVAGLKPYRLAGLIGLALCMVRMFLIDIEDDLYRIFAFLAVAVALLAIGYLYYRFRHLIEKADHWESESKGEKVPAATSSEHE